MNNELTEIKSSLPTCCDEVTQAVVLGGKIDSVQAVVEQGGSTLGRHIREDREKDVRLVIRALLAKLRDDLHVNSELTDDNILHIERRLIDDPELRWWLKIEDVALLCRRITQGFYGHFYGHFSEVEFGDCLVRYCHERAEVHRVANDKTVASGDPAVLEEVGYKMDAHGNLIVPEARQGVAKKKPMRYIYNEKGEITGENPAYWGKVRQEKSREEMEVINKGNAVIERAMKIMKEKGVDYMKAYDMATEIEKHLAKSKETTERTLHIMDEQGIGYEEAYGKALEEQKTTTKQ